MPALVFLRRGLEVLRFALDRPRPVLARADPDREAILGRLRALLRDLPDDETAVFQDEADLNLNPEVGCMWMARGRQAGLPTPGDNEKCYLAGSLHWRTGRLFETVGPRRDGALFVRHLDELRLRLQRESSLYELVWGHGILSWDVDGTRIVHPLVTTQVQLSFDPGTGALSLEPETLIPHLEIDLLQGLGLNGFDLLVDIREARGRGLTIRPIRTRSARTTNGLREVTIYSLVRLTIQGRDTDVRVAEVPEGECDKMGSDVLALGPRRARAVEGNPDTRRRMGRAGVEVVTYEGAELSKGDGGPTCLTLPLQRR